MRTRCPCYPGILKFFVALFLKDTKILPEYYNNYDDFTVFCLEAVKRTVDNEPVYIVEIPDKLNNDHSNLCNNMMKTYRKNILYRNISPIRFFPLSLQRSSPT